MPLSKFIIEIVENALAEESDLKPRGEIVNELSRLKEENKKMTDDLRLKNIVLEIMKKSFNRYRGETFLIDEFQGSRKYSRELITLLKQHETIDSYRILEALGIDPREADLAKGISTELEELENDNLITSTTRGWKWKDEPKQMFILCTIIFNVCHKKFIDVPFISEIGVIVRGFIKMRSLSTNEIGIFASHSEAHKRDVEEFLDTVGQAGTEEGALLNLHYDARLYDWDISTVLAIEAGIRSAYTEEVVNREALESNIQTPLPGGHYSLWPQRDI